MLTLNLHKIFEVRGIKKPLAFMVKCGLTYNTAWRFLNGPLRRVDMKHLGKLCYELNCTPNDILQWHAPPNTIENADHPLNALKPAVNQPTISQLLQNFPISKLQDLQKAIEELKDSPSAQ
jgi:DNA-binding Xre family transcriptional regulator